MTSVHTEELKQKLIDDLNERVEDQIIERANADLLIKLISKADTIDEAVSIAELGTTYKRTGFHFDKRLDKVQTSDTIRYLKKNEALSFSDGGGTPHHKLIIGDNYDALRQLLITHKNSIDVIYIDPPYGKDKMGDFASTNYDNAISRDNLLSMLYPRLLLAKQLLSENGVIFCSIDDRNQAYLKGLCDEIFKETNFVGEIIRKTKSMTGDDGCGLNLQHESLLIYAKNRTELKLNGEMKSYEGYSNPDNDPNGDWISGDPSAKSGSESTYFKIVNPYTKKHDYPPTGRYWAFSEQTLKEYINSGKVKFKTEHRENERGFIFKRYKKDALSKNEAVNSLFAVDNSCMNQVGTKELKAIFGDNNFSYPKPVEFIKKIIKYSSNTSTIVLDFFAGSGTTGHAVQSLNKEDGGERQFILITNNEATDINPNGIAYDVTSKRLKRVMTGQCYDGTNNFEWIKNNDPLGGSLDVYEIESVADFAQEKGKTPFDVIDETAYGESFDSIEDKIKWVCQNFDQTQKYLEED